MKFSFKNIFSFRLYVEGLKKVRLVGVAAAITTIVLNALIPFLDIVGGGGRGSKTYISYGAFIPFSLMMMLFSVIMVQSMFSFLNERRDSDFYHSIPQKRICVYLSFLSAVLTWIAGILFANSLFNAILWALAPHYTFAASSILIAPLIMFLAAAFTGAFMALAMMLTGTSVSNWLIFTLLFLFVRTVGGLFVACLGDLIPFMSIEHSAWHILTPTFFLPFALLPAVIGSVTRHITTGLVLYTIAATVVLYGLAGLAYVKRRSESANKSAPSRLLQHVYRSAVTLPFLLLGAFVMIGSREFDFSIAFLFLLLAFIVHAIFELMTTKKLKNLWRSLPVMLVPILLTGAFTLSVYGAQRVVLSDPIEADEIESVGFYWGNTYAADYNAIRTSHVAVDDEEAKAIVADLIAYASQAVEEGYYGTTKYYGGRATTHNTIFVKLKSGQTRVLNLRMLRSSETALEQILKQSPEYQKAQIALPADRDIRNIYLDQFGNDQKSLDRIWATFVSEYTALDPMSRSELLLSSSENAVNMIQVSGTYEGVDFYADYPLSVKYTPQTLSLWLQLREKEYVRGSSEFTTAYDILSSGMLDKGNTFSVFLDMTVDGANYTEKHEDIFDEEDDARAVIEILGGSMTDGRRWTLDGNVVVRFYFTIQFYGNAQGHQNGYYAGELVTVLSEEEYKTLLTHIQ